MDNSTKQNAEPKTDAGEAKLELHKETVHDLDVAATEDGVRGGAVAESNNCSAFCPTLTCITTR